MPGPTSVPCEAYHHYLVKHTARMHQQHASIGHASVTRLAACTHPTRVTHTVTHTHSHVRQQSGSPALTCPLPCPSYFSEVSCHSLGQLPCCPPHLNQQMSLPGHLMRRYCQVRHGRPTPTHSPTPTPSASVGSSGWQDDVLGRPDQAILHRLSGLDGSGANRR